MLEKVKNILADMRVNLLRIKLMWEQSGQGEGGLRTNRNQPDEREALDDKASFLNGLPAYLLILWELADRHDLLESTLQILDASVAAADASSAPSVLRTVVRGSPTDSSMGRTAASGMAPDIRTCHVHLNEPWERRPQYALDRRRSLVRAHHSHQCRNCVALPLPPPLPKSF